MFSVHCPRKAQKETCDMARNIRIICTLSRFADAIIIIYYYDLCVRDDNSSTWWTIDKYFCTFWATDDDLVYPLAIVSNNISSVSSDEPVSGSLSPISIEMLMNHTNRLWWTSKFEYGWMANTIFANIFIQHLSGWSNHSACIWMIKSTEIAFNFHVTSDNWNGMFT